MNTTPHPFHKLSCDQFEAIVDDVLVFADVLEIDRIEISDVREYLAESVEHDGEWFDSFDERDVRRLYDTVHTRDG